MLKEARLLEGVQEWWEHNSQVIRRVGEVLGTSRKKFSGDMKTWWGNDEVPEVVIAKKDAKKI